MIIAALFAIHARDLLSSVIAQSIVGYGLVLCFLFLKAPDLAIVQIVVETITVITIVAVLHDSTRTETTNPLCRRNIVAIAAAGVMGLTLLFYFINSLGGMSAFGEHRLLMSEVYVSRALEYTGAANIVKGILWDFRALDTLGEAAVLFTTAIGVLAILRLRGRKD